MREDFGEDGGGDAGATSGGFCGGGGMSSDMTSQRCREIIIFYTPIFRPERECVSILARPGLLYRGGRWDQSSTQFFGNRGSISRHTFSVITCSPAAFG